LGFRNRVGIRDIFEAVLRSLLIFAILCLGTVEHAAAGPAGAPTPLCPPDQPDCGLNDESKWEEWILVGTVVAIPVLVISLIRRKPTAKGRSEDV